VAEFKKILLIEDNVELRNLYEIFLKQHGYNVRTASDGELGMEAARQFTPDLIFLDIMMPKKDGYEVLKALRHDSSYGCTKTKIVILTNLGDSSRVDPALRADMDGYVIKAEIDINSLVNIIKSFE
jgi:DNA-binding response OmpR family regulator